MAEASKKADDDKEVKIPVFSVLKNGTVLKNIFLNNPQWLLSGDDDDRCLPVLIGRHPDCHVVLDHPSISRFHLELRARPSSLSLSVTDRSSVHGTWVSGSKIPADIPVVLSEGDTVRLGTSTRVYRLHWIPLSSAFELDNRPLPAVLEENEENHHMENPNGLWAEVIPSAPPMLESFFLPLESENQRPERKGFQEDESRSSFVAPMEEESNAQSGKECLSPLTSERRVVQSASLLSRRSKFRSVSFLRVQTGRSKQKNGELSCDGEAEVGKEAASAVIEPGRGEETFCRALFTELDGSGEEEEEEEEEEDAFVSDKENMTPLSSIAQKLKRNAKENRATTEPSKREEEALCRSLFRDLDGGREEEEQQEEETYVSDKENMTPLSSTAQKLKRNSAVTEPDKREEVLCRSIFRVLDGGREEEELEEAYVSDKENMMTPLSSTAQKLKTKAKENSAVTEPGKREVRVLDGGREEEEIEEAYVSDKENMTPLSSTAQKLKRKVKENSAVTEPGKREEVLCMSLFRDLDGGRGEEEEETYVSDKENLTHLSSTAQKLKRKAKENSDVTEPGKREEALCRSLLREINEGREEEENFLSDKENLTPGASRGRKTKKQSSKSHTGRAKLVERAKERIPFQSLLDNSPSGNNSPLSSSSYGHRQVGKERAPFQSLVEKSPLRNSSPVNYARKLADEGDMDSSSSHTRTMGTVQSLAEKSPLRNSSPVNFARKLAVEGNMNSSSLSHTQVMETSSFKNNNPANYAQRLAEEGNMDFSFSHTRTAENELRNSSSLCMKQLFHKEGGKKMWIMVVDVGCLLNEESRKSLQLLEGLKGTHLIIPRIVIRELDCLKRRECLLRFRKETKAASSVLQWIEDCMVKCSWWIHVQSSLETLPVPATPPATPRSQSGDGSEGPGNGASSPTAFSTCGSLMEIVSPTAEDHILDCALLFKRIKDDGQLVLLSNSIALKIKGMAEGLICETSKEFHASLVNPYSKRFLWSDSAPRGATWSCLDEVAVIDGYCRQFPAVRRLPKPTDDVKGLKLILLHNSHYGKTNLVK